MAPSPFFRLNLLLEIPRPSPTAVPRSDEAEDSADDAHTHNDGDGRDVVLLPASRDSTLSRSTRKHPRVRLRLTALVTVVVGLVLNAFADANALNWTMRRGPDLSMGMERRVIVDMRMKELTVVATGVLLVSLIWQLVDLFCERIFKRKLPNWVVGSVETLGFLAFTTLFVLAQVAVNAMLNSLQYYHNEGAMVILVYDSIPWAISSIIHAILIVHCVRRYLNTKKRCIDCGRKAESKGKGKAAGDAEDNLLGESAGEGSALYRDEEAGESTLQP